MSVCVGGGDERGEGSGDGGNKVSAVVWPCVGLFTECMLASSAVSAAHRKCVSLLLLHAAAVPPLLQWHPACAEAHFRAGRRRGTSGTDQAFSSLLQPHAKVCVCVERQHGLDRCSTHGSTAAQAAAWGGTVVVTHPLGCVCHVEVHTCCVIACAACGADCVHTVHSGSAGRSHTNHLTTAAPASACVRLALSCTPVRAVLCCAVQRRARQRVGAAHAAWL